MCTALTQQLVDVSELPSDGDGPVAVVPAVP